MNPSTDLQFVDPITSISAKWEKCNILNSTAIIKDRKVYLMYRVQDLNGTSRIGMTVSDGGLNLKKNGGSYFIS